MNQKRTFNLLDKLSKHKNIYNKANLIKKIRSKLIENLLA